LRRIAPLLLGTLCIAQFCWIGSASAERVQKPVKEQTIYPSFIGPPPTLNETMLSAELVVLGRVLGNSPRDKAHVENGGTWIRTGHRVKVLDVFRAPAGSDLGGHEITVVQSGGERDRGTHIERLSTHGFPLLEIGKEYVLLLARAGGEEWGSAYGPDGAFERFGDRVLPLGKSETSARQRNQDWDQFLQVLRNLGIQRGGN
jgi:hypothetical protein